MTKIGMLFACVLVAACGGGSGNGQAQEPAAIETEPMPDTAAYEAPAPDPVEEPAPEPEPEPAPPPPPMTAIAELRTIKGDKAMGTLVFEKGEDGQIMITGQFTGLKKKGVNAIYIHEKGDCGNKGKAAGAHLNPTKAKHGPPASSSRHAGDFGNITADETGTATFSMITDSVTMEADRPDSVLGRAVVIHSKKDDKKGNGGPALACGVVQLATGETPVATTSTPSTE